MTHSLLDELVERARAVDGQSAFSDQTLVELARGRRRMLGEPGRSAAIIGRTPDGDVEFELVVHPEARRRGLGTALVARVLDEEPEARFAWAHGDHPASRVLAERFGFRAVRTLLQLRAPVDPADAASSALEADSIRTFRPGADDAAWLDLNARAFADHPEQGALKQTDLDARKAEDWFDADDFLLLWDGDELIGSCWLKITGDLGEIYAIAIAPEAQGRGLGKALLSAGLARIAERGIRTASLYVEADNEPALRLYARHGFTRHTIDVRYERPLGR